MRSSTPPGVLAPLKDIWQTARDFFSLDLRTLALFRIGLAVIILGDIANRWPDLTALDSDEGLYPRSDIINGQHVWLLNNFIPSSIHVLHGSPTYQMVLHLLAVVFAIGLLVGYKTSFMTLMSWFLLMSAQARNPVCIQGGDTLLRLLAFWGMFLPLGAYYSVDAATTARRLNRQYRVCTPASAAFILQVCFVYWFTVAWKSDPAWREEGSAVYYALNVEGFTTRIGLWLLQFPTLMKLLTWGTMTLELFGPVLLFIPFANGLLRVLVVASFITFHVGLGLCMELGNFPPTCCLAWVALLPGWFWDKLTVPFRNPARETMVLCFDASRRSAGKAAALLRTFLLLDGAELLPLSRDAERRATAAKRRSWLILTHQGKDLYGYEAVVHLTRLSPLFCRLAGLLQWRLFRGLGEWLFRRVGMSKTVPPAEPREVAPAPLAPTLVQNTLVIFFLVYILAINIRTLPKVEDKSFLPEMAMILGTTLGLDQGWGLFAPKPGTLDGWYVIVGTLKNGQEVNLFTGGYSLEEVKIGTPVSWEKPALVSATYANSRWRKYYLNLYLEPYFTLRPYFADYLSREWNARHKDGEELTAIEMFFMAKTTPPPDEPSVPPEKRLLLRWDCLRRQATPDPRVVPPS